MGFVSGALQIRFRGGLRIGYLGKLGKLAPRRIFSPPEDTVQKCRCLLFSRPHFAPFSPLSAFPHRLRLRAAPDHVRCGYGPCRSRADQLKFSSSFGPRAWAGGGVVLMLARLPIQVELLETRRLLSASISNRVLTVIGGAGNDGISLSRTGGDDVIATVNGATWQFDMDNFDSAVLSGVAGNDRIANASGIENVSLDGGSGDDRLVDGNGDNTLIGVGGNDTLSPGTGDDFLSGGSGTDTVDYSPHSAGLRFRLTSFFGAEPTVSRTGETDRLATFENADEDSILDNEHFIGTAFRDTFHYQASEQDIAGDFPLITAEGRGGNDGFSTAGVRGLFVAIGGSGDDTFGINAGLGGFGQRTTL